MQAHITEYLTKTEVGVINKYKEVQNVNTGDNYGFLIQNVNNQVVDLGKQITCQFDHFDSLILLYIRTWLSPSDSSKNYHAASGILMSQPASCLWFLDGESFSTWLAKPGFLWIKGKSGCGKTILSSAIIDHLSKSQCSLATGYFFFDGRDSQKELQLHDKLIRSLIWQFSLKCGGSVPKVLGNLYSRCGGGYQQPSLDDLHNVLQMILCGFDSAYIILDALDECSERDKVLDWVQSVILLKDENLRLHLITTSRPEKEINDKFDSYECLDLVEASENHDIELYLDHQLQTKSEWQKWGSDIQNEIKLTLRQQADGMFRWVALQLMELKKCRTKKGIRKQLKNLPKGLDETYDQILLGIDKNDCCYTQIFLLWLCFASRPMTLEELAATVTVDLAAENGPQFECENKIQDISDVLKMCSSFVIESEGKIKLAHFSIKEYLLSKHVEEHCDEQVKAFSLSQELSDLMISQTCLAYLLQFETPKSVNDADLSLMEYAAKNWIFHVQSSNDDKSQESSLSELIMKLLTPNNLAFDHWVEIYDPYNASKHLPPLYYACQAGLIKVTISLLKNGADVNTWMEGEYGHVLQVASYEGHEAIAKLLINNGADVNAQGGEYGNALQAASFCGHEIIAKLLIENGADVNAQGGEYGNALQAALFWGHEAVAKLLIEKGADVNAQEGEYGNDLQYRYALQRALFSGDEAIAKFLNEYAVQ
ncbi:hypothetical protein K443DRAFT_107302 [Laccaria amethystina LaAM-08-1]|uniref:NACHT domain-containing protein n=1 Tax=Laccaria amethystina LaAM-08-1 TaxID=1095629 RepID=A0A0C9WKJ5_9AGAR|nr:hypothetical protein K443DRAFT_107302 [Laccaria amethystina LaAM-08-1]